MNWKSEVQNALFEAIKNYLAGTDGSLRLAVLDTYNNLEKAVRNYLIDNSVSNPQGMSLSDMVHKYSDKFSASTYSHRIHEIAEWELNSYRRIRNQVVHEGIIPSKELVCQFLTFAINFLKGLPIDIEITESDLSQTRRFLNFQIQSKNFLGRQEDINRVRQSILSHRLVTLHGIGGVGKTSLAIHVAQKHLSTNFVDGTAFISCANISQDSNALFREITRILGKSDQDIYNEQELFRFLKHQDFLLLLDNWETIHTAETGAFLQRLLTQTHHIHVLITSQQVVGLDGIEKVEPINPMQVDSMLLIKDIQHLDAYALFLDRARMTNLGPNWYPNDIQALREVLQYTDGLPLAIEFVAARAYERTLADLARGLKESRLSILRRRTAAVPTMPLRHDSLEACFEWTYQLLSPEAQAFFPTVGIFVGGFTSEAAAFIGATKQMEQALDTLRDAALVQFNTQTGRYSALPIIQDFAQDKVKEDMQIYRGLHAEYFKDLSNHHGDKEIEDLKNEDLDTIELELGNILSGLDFFYNSSDYDGLVLSVRGLRHFFWRRGYWQVGCQALQWGIDSAQLIGDKISEAQFKHRLGTILEKKNNMKDAELLHSESLELWRQLSDPIGEATALYALSSIKNWQSKYREAMYLVKKSLAISEKMDDKYGQALALHQIGYLIMGKGGLTQAEEAYRLALEIREKIPDVEGIIATSRNLGDLYRKRMKYIIANNYYQKALEMSNENGNRRATGATLHRLGQLAFDQNDYNKAHTYFDLSLEIKRDLGDYPGEAATLKEIGRLERREGNISAAIQHWNRSLEIFEERGSREARNIRRLLLEAKQELGNEKQL